MAEKDIRTSLDHLLTGEDSGATCPPEYMVQCAQRAKERLELTTSAFAEYSKDQSSGLGAPHQNVLYVGGSGCVLHSLQVVFSPSCNWFWCNVCNIWFNMLLVCYVKNTAHDDHSAN